MSTFETTRLSACVDCAMIVANGTLGDEDAAADEAHAAKMSAYLGADNVKIGTLVSGSDHRDEHDFGSRPCEACGDTDAGGRMSLTILTEHR